MEKNIKNIGRNNILLLVLETIVLVVIFSLFVRTIEGTLGNPNVTVTTYLEVGTVAPEILNVSIENGSSSITLIPNSTKAISCVGLIRDYNNETNIHNASAEFYINTSSYGDSDDNNTHYTNSTCIVNRSFNNWSGVDDDSYHALANCTFQIQYYANGGIWNCTIYINDSDGLNATGNNSINVSDLIAIDMPNSISYGTVNATYMSLENVTNISNAGNVGINLSLKGWAIDEGDGNAMNCSQGSIRNISVEHEKFNVTNSTAGILTLNQTILNYTNLTSTSTVIFEFPLLARINDGYNDAANATYWRIYVPSGVAGSCQGNIQFGATQSEAD
ncbi:hypothetical protein GOV12_06690 [Candidatus Pacearchaeota archaeon]|nr:hypothetical protein [Candidatus Pacearchaeota archaeon]